MNGITDQKHAVCYKFLIVYTRVRNYISGVGVDTKIFTLEEARGVLPEVVSLFQKIFDLNKNAKGLSADVENLVDIWGKDVFESSHQDHKEYNERVRKRDDVLSEIQNHINQIHEIGCIVKNVDQGLVDFLHENNGEIIYLCWKYGEDDIIHWHGVNEGFIGRRHIKELLGKQAA